MGAGGFCADFPHHFSCRRPACQDPRVCGGAEWLYPAFFAGHDAAGGAFWPFRSGEASALVVCCGLGSGVGDGLDGCARHQHADRLMDAIPGS